MLLDIAMDQCYGQDSVTARLQTMGVRPGSRDGGGDGRRAGDGQGLPLIPPPPPPPVINFEPAHQRLGERERGNDTSRSTGRSGRQDATCEGKNG